MRVLKIINPESPDKVFYAPDVSVATKFLDNNFHWSDGEVGKKILMEIVDLPAKEYQEWSEKASSDSTKREFPCPICKVDHLVEFTEGEGKSDQKSDPFGEFGFDDHYYRWICPVTNKVVITRMYWGGAFPI